MENLKTSRRDFIRKSALSAIGFAFINKEIFANSETTSPAVLDMYLGKGDAFTQKPLPYDFGALEPYIDKMTMEIHYTKHHAGYVKKLNEAVAATPELQGKSLSDILMHISTLPDAMRAKVRNNAGGHWNHSFFWETLIPGSAKTITRDDLRTALMSKYNSMENFQEEFNKAAAGVFGSGWAWLVKDAKGNLDIIGTPNQDNPLMDISEKNGKPLLGVDVWEHAYYLKYQNRRSDYLSAFWNIINWDTVSQRFAE